MVIQELDRAIDNLRAYGETPDKKPEEYILVEKNDSILEDQIWKSTIEVQSISRKAKIRASWINDQVISRLRTMQHDRISACELITSYSSTKTSIKEYSYKAVFQITHYQEV